MAMSLSSTSLQASHKLMNIPKFLYHYYESTRAPFLSMSELLASEFSKIMDEFSKNDTTENGFDLDWKRDFYKMFRPYTESFIRGKFIEKGGQPKLKAPRYLSLGPCPWFMNWYKNPAEIKIPLDDIPSDSISFTYPDSMMSLLIAEDRFEPFAKFKQPYHGRVYRLEELANPIEQYGMPDQDDPINQEYGNRLVEAQVWDLNLLSHHTESV